MPIIYWWVGEELVRKLWWSWQHSSTASSTGLLKVVSKPLFSSSSKLAAQLRISSTRVSPLPPTPYTCINTPTAISKVKFSRVVKENREQGLGKRKRQCIWNLSIRTWLQLIITSSPKPSLPVRKWWHTEGHSDWWLLCPLSRKQGASLYKSGVSSTWTWWRKSLRRALCNTTRNYLVSMEWHAIAMLNSFFPKFSNTPDKN